MNIKQALKEKNKLVKKLAEEFAKFNQNNSVELGVSRSYNPGEALVEWIKTSKDLTTLKAKIHRANAEVYDKIFQLAELKSILKQLKSVDCSEGKQQNHYRHAGVEATVKEAFLTIPERDKMVKDMEEQIEDLQEFLDEHNAKTHID